MSNKKIQFSLTHKFLQSHEFGCNFLHDFIGASIDGHGTDIPPCSGDGIFFKYTKITEKVKTAVSHSFHHLSGLVFGHGGFDDDIFTLDMLENQLIHKNSP